MAQRITRKHMEAQVSIINGFLGIEGEVSYNTVGAIRLDGAYGGWGVHKVVNEHGGVADLIGGHFPARETSRFLSGMIAALRLDKS